MTTSTLTTSNLNGGTLHTVNAQWRSRPDDERFVSLTDLHAHAVAVRSKSAGRTVSSRALTVIPASNDQPEGLTVAGPNGVPAEFTNWAFGQLCSRASSPAGFLRDLPAPIVADVLNYQLKHAREIEDIGVLLHRPDGATAPTLRACTGPNYGRIWNSTITGALINRFGDGVTGHFKVPGIRGKALAEVTRENTTLYASDRDMFVFLADEERRIEVPNRRNGQPGSFARGVIISNSEVGGGTLYMAALLFDFSCMNRILWNVDQIQELRVRHTAGAPDRWVEEVAPAIEAYALSSTASLERALTSAREKRVDDVSAFLRSRFTGAQASAIVAAHMADEQRPMESVFDVVTGVTAYARGIQWQDQRVNLEREAGKIMALAA